MKELRDAKAQLEDAVKGLLLEFEQKYGADSISTIGFIRWNGSNNAFGSISKVLVTLLIR